MAVVPGCERRSGERVSIDEPAIITHDPADPPATEPDTGDEDAVRELFPLASTMTSRRPVVRPRARN